ncbi:MAG: SHOCT domain-containing protein [Okeania sp. SIO3C4]|nr:SHOCT domain-containing protein [Okeania sp. SIO3C4]
MPNRVLYKDVRSNENLDTVVEYSIQEFRILGGSIRRPAENVIFITSGKQGVRFGFTINVQAKITIDQFQNGIFNIKCLLDWNPSPLVWTCLTVGFFIFGILWIVAALFLFVNVVNVYQQILDRLETVIGRGQSFTPNPELLPGKKPNDITNNSNDITLRLQELKKMYDSGLITQEEYEAKRKDIISKI